MSWSVYLENFRGEPVENQVAVRALLEPLLDGAQRNVVVDGAPTQVYGLDSDPIDGLSFSRLTGDRIWDVIYQAAVLSGTAVVLQDGPVCITDDAHRVWVPDELVQAVGVRRVDSGADLAQVVAEI